MSALDNPLTADVFYGLPLICLFIHYTSLQLASLHDQSKSGFFGGPDMLSSKSERFEKNSKSSDWLEKIWPSKKATFILGTWKRGKDL